MKRIVTLLLILCMPAACQPTPDHNAVRQKDTVPTVESVKAANGQISDEPTALVRAQMPARLN